MAHSMKWVGLMGMRSTLRSLNWYKNVHSFSVCIQFMFTTQTKRQQRESVWFRGTFRRNITRRNVNTRRATLFTFSKSLNQFIHSIISRLLIILQQMIDHHQSPNINRRSISYFQQNCQAGH